MQADEQATEVDAPITVTKTKISSKPATPQRDPLTASKIVTQIEIVSELQQKDDRAYQTVDQRQVKNLKQVIIPPTRPLGNIFSSKQHFVSFNEPASRGHSNKPSEVEDAI